MADRGSIQKKTLHPEVNKFKHPRISKVRQTKLDRKSIDATNRTKKDINNLQHLDKSVKIHFLSKQIQTQRKVFESTEVQTDLLNNQIQINSKNNNSNLSKVQRVDNKSQQYNDIYSNKSGSIILTDYEIDFLLKSRQKKIIDKFKMQQQKDLKEISKQKNIIRKNRVSQSVNEYPSINNIKSKNKSHIFFRKIKPNKQKQINDRNELKKSQKYHASEILKTEPNQIKKNLKISQISLKNYQIQYPKKIDVKPCPFIIGKNRHFPSLPKFEKLKKKQSKQPQMRSYSQNRQNNDVEFEQYFYLSLQQEQLVDGIKDNLQLLEGLSYDNKSYLQN